MTAAVVRADYDALTQAAGSFGQQAEQARRTLEQLNREVDGLEAGDWLGQGAQAFYAEMNGQILPSMRRLVRALEAAADVTRQVNQIAQQAEKEAAAFLRLDGNGNGAGAAIAAAAAGLAAAGSDVGGAGGAGDIPDGASALWKPRDRRARGRRPSKKPGATVSATSKTSAEEGLADMRVHNPQLAKAIENDPALRAGLEHAMRAGYRVWTVVNGSAAFDEPGLNIFVDPTTTVAEFKRMARLANDHPRILSNLDEKAVAAIKRDPVLLERVLAWGENVDPANITYLEMGRTGDTGIKKGRNGTGTTISIDPKDPAGSLSRLLNIVDRGK